MKVIKTILRLLSANEAPGDRGTPAGRFDLTGADGKSVFRHTVLPAAAVALVAVLQYFADLGSAEAAALLVSVPGVVRFLQRWFSDGAE